MQQVASFVEAHQGYTLNDIAWEPQPGPQQALVNCPIEDAFFGGSRGGGKTDGLLGAFNRYALKYGRPAKGIFFRRSYPELEEVERRAHEIFPYARAKWKAQKRTWVWPNGATLRLRYLYREQDASAYQGHSYTWVGADELTHWTTPEPLDKIRATLRSPEGIPCYFRGSGNPGGPGHGWVKLRYIDPAAPMVPYFDEESQVERVFIPSRLEDNLKLGENDPHYWKRVMAAAAGRQDLVKAWRWGMWDIVAGGMFDDIWHPSVHIVKPFKIPFSWRIDRSFDWGSSAPFSVGWWAESDGTRAPNGIHYPPGSLFRIHEWYGWNGKPNQGLKMLARDIAKGINERQGEMLDENNRPYVIYPGPADASIYDAENGVCIADDMGEEGVYWEPCDKSPGSRVAGWLRMRSYMAASVEKPKEHPGLYVFEHCRQFIRTVPVMARSERNPDDLDTTAEDHPSDEARYRIMHVRYSSGQQRLGGH